LGGVGRGGGGGGEGGDARRNGHGVRLGLSLQPCGIATVDSWSSNTTMVLC
jgi:hypothetical protein